MGAGFGHTYVVNYNTYTALAFNTSDAEVDDIEVDAIEFERDELYELLEALDTITVTFKHRTFIVDTVTEATYNGDDLVLVPKNLWESYADAIEESSTQPDKINWQAAAAHEDDLVKTFEWALCNEVFKKYPYMYTRRRILGWCGTGYKSVEQLLLELAF